MNERLSQHMTLGELCKTSVRIENVPGVAQVENLRRGPATLQMSR